MLTNKLPLEALQVSHETQAEQLAWLVKNRASIMAQAEAYEAENTQPVPIDPSVWLGYQVAPMRIARPARFLSNQFAVLSNAVKQKRPIKNILGYLFATIKQLV